MTIPTLITFAAYFIILLVIVPVAALLGMTAGTIVLVVWKQMGLSERMYEIVPGFIANSLVILVVNRIAQQEDARVLRQFDEVATEI